MTMRVPQDHNTTATSLPPTNNEELGPKVRAAVSVAMAALAAYGSYKAFTKGLNIVKVSEMYLPNDDAIDSWTRIIEPTVINTIKSRTYTYFGANLATLSAGILAQEGYAIINKVSKYSHTNMKNHVTITAACGFLMLSFSYAHAVFKTV